MLSEVEAENVESPGSSPNMLRSFLNGFSGPVVDVPTMSAPAPAVPAPLPQFVPAPKAVTTFNEEPGVVLLPAIPNTVEAPQCS